MYVPLGNVASIPLAGGVSQPLALPTTHYLRALIITVTATVTLGAAPTVFQDGLARSLGFTVWFDNDPAIDLPGDHVLHYFGVIQGTAQDYTEVPAVVGAQTGTWRFVLPMSDNRNVSNPDQSMRDMRLATNPRIVVTNRGTGFISASVTSGAFDSITVTVNADVLPVPAAFPALPVLVQRFFRSKTFTTSQISASSTNELDYYRGRIARRYGFIARNQAASPVRSDSVVSEVELMPNYVKQGLITWQQLKTYTRDQFDLAPPTGVGVMDLDTARMFAPAQMLDLRGVPSMIQRVVNPALASGIELGIVEESVILPTPEVVKAYNAAIQSLRG